MVVITLSVTLVFLLYTDEDATFASKHTTVAFISSLHIMTTVNTPYLDMYWNWITSIHRLQSNNLKNITLWVVAEDDASYTTLNTHYKTHNSPFQTLNILRGNSTDSNTSLRYGNKRYFQEMALRPSYLWNLASSLRDGQRILFTDVDTVWLQDPTSFLRVASDILYLDDAPWWMHELSYPLPCAGFVMFHLNPPVRNLLRQWVLESKHIRGSRLSNDQSVLQNLIYTMGIHSMPLPRWAFTNGDVYFRQLNKIQRRFVVVMHNNFISGFQTKMDRMKAAGLWFTGN